MRSKKGGVKIKDDYTLGEEEAFYDYIKNSNITYYANGNFGLVLKAEIKDISKSPYISQRYYDNDEPIKHLLIKIVFIDDEEIELPPTIMDKEFDFTSSQDFDHETKIQKEIFDKTNNNGDAICAALIYKDRNINNEQFLDAIKDTSVYSVLHKFLSSWEAKIGIIAMELLDCYEIMYHYQTIKIKEFDKTITKIYEKYTNHPKKRLEKYKSLNIDNLNYVAEVLALILSDLIRCYKIGYIQGDFHMGNVLFNPKEQYIEAFKGRSLLIDFGYTFEVPDEIKEETNNEQIIKNLLETTNPYYKFKPETWVSYQWLVFVNNNESLKELVLENIDIIETQRKRLERKGGSKKYKTFKNKKYGKKKNSTEKRRSWFYNFPVLGRALK